MKKLIVIAFLAAFIGTLISTSVYLILKHKTNIAPEAWREELLIESGIWEDKEWANQKNRYSLDVIPNAQSAANAAQAILHNLDWGDTKSCIPEAVFYDVADSVWVVYFRQTSDKSDEIILDGGFFVAIQKSDGRVLCIWPE